MKQIVKSYKFRIYPNNEQEILLNKTFGCVRYYWNYMTSVFNSFDKDTNVLPEYLNTTEIRKKYDWIREVSQVSIQQKERDFDRYKKQFFNKTSNKKRPVFKHKKGVQSFRLSNTSFRIIDDKIRLPKMGEIRIVFDRNIPKDVKILNLTISKNTSGQYFASIAVKEVQKLFSKTGKDVGLDVGIKTFSTHSDGIEVDNPKYFSKNQAKLKRLQQHFYRKQKGSKRRDKCRLKIAKLYQKITNQRDWFLHNYSTYLIENYDRIFIEDLDVRGLLEKKQLSKEISDVSWSKFFQMLQYKADWYGKEVIKVDRYYASSKTCGCGVKNENLKLSDRVWTCNSCGTQNKRDELASKNILKEGRRSSGDLV